MRVMVDGVTAGKGIELTDIPTERQMTADDRGHMHNEYDPLHL